MCSFGCSLLEYRSFKCWSLFFHMVVISYVVLHCVVLYNCRCWFLIICSFEDCCPYKNKNLGGLFFHCPNLSQNFWLLKNRKNSEWVLKIQNLENQPRPIRFAYLIRTKNWLEQKKIVQKKKLILKTKILQSHIHRYTFVPK